MVEDSSFSPLALYRFQGSGIHRERSAKDILTSEVIAMKVFLTGATGYIGSAIAEAASHAAGVSGQTRSWALTNAQQMMGALADALVLDRQVSSAKARQVLDWQPQTPSLFDELKGGTDAIG
jgi:hypothetical protein